MIRQLKQNNFLSDYYDLSLEVDRAKHFVFDFILVLRVCLVFTLDNCVLNGLCFLKPFLKGKILRSSERGVNSILTTILRF